MLSYREGVSTHASQHVAAIFLAVLHSPLHDGEPVTMRIQLSALTWKGTLVCQMHCGSYGYCNKFERPEPGLMADPPILTLSGIWLNTWKENPLGQAPRCPADSNHLPLASRHAVGNGKLHLAVLHRPSSALATAQRTCMQCKYVEILWASVTLHGLRLGCPTPQSHYCIIANHTHHDDPRCNLQLTFREEAFAAYTST